MLAPTTGLETLSLREPLGRVYRCGDKILRAIERHHWPLFQRILESPSVTRLVAEGRCIPTTLTEGPAPARDSVWVEHPRLFFPSYPYEWPAEMLREAALLVVDMSLPLLDDCLGLKDATPLNILFNGPHPVHVDVLSFEERDPRDPIWAPWAQFLRTFYFPLLLSAELGIPSHFLHGADQETWGPEAVLAILGWKRFKPRIFPYLTLPRWFNRFEKKGGYKPFLMGSPDAAKFVFNRRLSRVRLNLMGMNLAVSSDWDNYDSAHESYTAQAAAEKKTWVEGIFKTVHPRRTLDLGANTGAFSILAAEQGSKVVAVDSDASSVGCVWQKARERSLDILPLVVNLVRPSPSGGWCGRERSSFLGRVEQANFDMVLMLALMHHLTVAEQVPLGEVLDVAHQTTTEHLLIEFIGPSDPMTQRLARGRKTGIYPRDEFEGACRKRFHVQCVQQIGVMDRWLYWLTKV